MKNFSQIPKTNFLRSQICTPFHHFGILTNIFRRSRHIFKYGLYYEESEVLRAITCFLYFLSKWAYIMKNVWLWALPYVTWQLQDDITLTIIVMRVLMDRKQLVGQSLCYKQCLHKWQEACLAGYGHSKKANIFMKIYTVASFLQTGLSVVMPAALSWMNSHEVSVT